MVLGHMVDIIDPKKTRIPKNCQINVIFISIFSETINKIYMEWSLIQWCTQCMIFFCWSGLYNFKTKSSTGQSSTPIGQEC